MESEIQERLIPASFFGTGSDEWTDEQSALDMDLQDLVEGARSRKGITWNDIVAQVNALARRHPSVVDGETLDEGTPDALKDGRDQSSESGRVPAKKRRVSRKYPEVKTPRPHSHQTTVNAFNPPLRIKWTNRISHLRDKIRSNHARLLSGKKPSRYDMGAWENVPTQYAQKIELLTEVLDEQVLLFSRFAGLVEHTTRSDVYEFLEGWTRKKWLPEEFVTYQHQLWDINDSRPCSR